VEDDDGAGGEILFDAPASEKAAAVMVGRFGLVELSGAAMLPGSLHCAGSAQKTVRRKKPARTMTEKEAGSFLQGLKPGLVDG